MESIIDNLPI